jgi:serine protease DegS
MRVPVTFILKSVVVGLAAAFVIQLWNPQWFPRTRVVELIESASPSTTILGPVSYADSVEKAVPAVVNIFTSKTVVERGIALFDDPVFRRFFGDRFQRPESKKQQTSLGSGVIASPQGYVLTNNHVINDADEILVALNDGRSAKAHLVGSDPEADLAILKIELNNLPSIVFGDSDRLRVGDVVMAIGNPFGVGKTVTMGIVSAKGRSDLGINTFENFIQTDAAINPGNSGGALITATGELIGINTAIFSKSGGSQGIGFAIPANLAKRSMAQIIEKGRVMRGWLGIEIQEITPELAESFQLKQQQGIIIAGVFRDSPAHKSGIEPGDILITFNGKPVSHTRTALNMIGMTTPGESIPVEIFRSGEYKKLTVSIGERPQVQTP